MLPPGLISGLVPSHLTVVLRLPHSYCSISSHCRTEAPTLLLFHLISLSYWGSHTPIVPSHLTVVLRLPHSYCYSWIYAEVELSCNVRDQRELCSSSCKVGRLYQIHERTCWFTGNVCTCICTCNVDCILCVCMHCLCFVIFHSHSPPPPSPPLSTSTLTLLSSTFTFTPHLHPHLHPYLHPHLHSPPPPSPPPSPPPLPPPSPPLSTSTLTTLLNSTSPLHTITAAVQGVPNIFGKVPPAPVSGLEHGEESCCGHSS